MLERRTYPNGVVAYVSPLLDRIGVPHAFTTRIGGTSPKPFDSLNLGNPGGCDIQDLSERIRGNYERLLVALGCPDRELLWVHQVHGGRVWCVEPGSDHDNSTQADGLITDDPTRILSVRVADCVPVLLSDDRGSTVAAVHAGWRGVIAGAVVEAVREMTQRSRLPAGRFVAAIGPAIGFESFEVGPEVIDEFDKAFGPEAPLRRHANGKGCVDLRECLRRQLTQAGVPENRIEVSDRCTFRDRGEFFSHRRDRGISGRMAAVISPAAA